MTKYRIDGAEVNSISDLYEQFNRELMADADWIMGQSLDALNDVLYGVDGAIRDGNPATFVWNDHAHSRETLGFDETQRWMLDKLARPGTFDDRRIKSELDDLRGGVGKTYFELILEVFADHPLIELQLH
ncbi:barstar family protein [Microbacterium sp. A93]|uniref:barstar family protein n=1 Tax=Microbacterium sp. A93 TaxID=3450716 RepID=UPI003F433420